ncbi:MAG TPA: hypothetical protein VMD52_08515 [Patescibacteria group bacterium]|nr:hypothetical protein [Patescibacteria group bacterium]
MDPKPWYRPFTTAALILAVTFLPRLLLLSKGPFHYDTLDLMVCMRSKAFTDHAVMFTLPSFLMIALAYLRDALWPAVTDLSLVLVTTAGVASLAAVVIYAVLRKVLTESAAVAYALVTSFFPVFFSITTFGRIDHALAFVFLPLCLYYLLQRKWFACAVYTGLSIASRPEAAFALSGFFIWAACDVFEAKAIPLKTKLWSITKAVLILFFVSALVWLGLSFALGRRMWFDQIVMNLMAKQFGKKDPLDTVVILQVDIRKAFAHVLTVLRLLSVSSLFLAFGLFAKIRQKSVKDMLLFFVSFFVCLTLVANFEMALNELRYLAVPVFFLAYFIAAGFEFVFKKAWRLFPACLLCATAMLWPVAPTIYDRHQRALQVDFARHLGEVTAPGSVIIAQDEWIFFKYYAGRDVIIPPSLCVTNDWRPFFEKVSAVVVARRPLYFTYTAISYDYCHILRKFIQKGFRAFLVDSYLNEDWHPDTIGRHVYREPIYLLVPNR